MVAMALEEAAVEVLALEVKVGMAMVEVDAEAKMLAQKATSMVAAEEESAQKSAESHGEGAAKDD